MTGPYDPPNRNSTDVNILGHEMWEQSRAALLAFRDLEKAAAARRTPGEEIPWGEAETRIWLALYALLAITRTISHVLQEDPAGKRRLPEYAKVLREKAGVTKDSLIFTSTVLRNKLLHIDEELVDALNEHDVDLLLDRNLIEVTDEDRESGGIFLRSISPDTLVLQYRDHRLDVRAMAEELEDISTKLSTEFDWRKRRTGTARAKRRRPNRGGEPAPTPEPSRI